MIEREHPLKHLVKETTKTPLHLSRKEATQSDGCLRKNPFKLLPFLNKPYSDVLDLDTVFYRRNANIVLGSMNGKKH